MSGNDVFKNTFITLSSKKAYGIIETNLEKILELENTLAVYFQELKDNEDNIGEIRNYNSMIENTKKEITELFFKCQNTIISHCFSYDLNNLHTLEDIKNLKNKIYNFREYIAVNSGYEFYNEFYRRLMEALDEKATYIAEHGIYEESSLSTDLAIIPKSKRIFGLFRRIFTKLGFIKQDSF